MGISLCIHKLQNGAIQSDCITSPVPAVILVPKVTTSQSFRGTFSKSRSLRPDTNVPWVDLQSWIKTPWSCQRLSQSREIMTSTCGFVLILMVACLRDMIGDSNHVLSAFASSPLPAFFEALPTTMVFFTRSSFRTRRNSIEVDRGVKVMIAIEYVLAIRSYIGPGTVLIRL